MGYTLRILDGPERGKSYFFDRIEITIGRTMENDLVLPDPGISRQHMSIRDKGGAYTLKDLGSSNGTKLNGRKVREEVLKPGDVITLGGATVKFELSGGSMVETGRGAPPRASRASGRPGRKPARRRTTPKPAEPVEAEDSAQESQEAASPDPLILSPGVRRKEPTGAARAPDKAAGRPTREMRSSGVPLEPLRGFLSRWTARGLKWFKSRDKKIQIAMLAALAVILMVVAVKIFQGGKQIVRQIRDHSDEKFLIGETDSNGEIMTYGLGPATMPCREKASFLFKYANGRATLTYAVAKINNKQEVEIHLNGILIDYAPITLDEWSDYIALKLPRKHLLENDENLLSFINSVNYNDPDAKEEWAVKVPLLEEAPLPSPDPDAAVEVFKLAKERMKSKDVAPQNLYRALEFFKKARDYLELLPEASRPDIYVEANEMVDKVERELAKRIHFLMFSAELAEQFEKYEKAKNIYRQVLLTIPDQDDPRHLQAREKFEEFE